MMKVVCAACGTVLKEGDGSKNISHGLCKICKVIYYLDYAAFKLKRKGQVDEK